jgi:hypothetical protein
VLLCSAALTVASVVVPVIPADAAPSCFGHAATIVGTAKDDDIQGTAGNDVIVTLGGNDSVSGRAGNDLICTGAPAPTGSRVVTGATGSPVAALTICWTPAPVSTWCAPAAGPTP